MDFGFSEEQGDVQNLARTILSEQVSAEKLSAFDEYAAERFDQALWAQLAEAGLLGIAIEEDYGGMGFGFTELALLIEESGRTIAPVPLIPVLVSAALAVQKFGTEQQKSRWLPGVVKGDTLLTAALSEELQFEIGAVTGTRAIVEGDAYRLSGSKTQVAFAHRAERIIVSAVTDNGSILVLVDPTAEGVELREQKVTTCEPTYQLVFDNVFIAAEDVLTGTDNGAEAVQWIAERTMAAMCAMQAGLADHAMRMTASFTAERKQFGVPVATFQAVGHRAANCYIDVECLRLTTYQAISRLDSGLDATTEVQIAKVWAGDTGHRVSYASQHLHGGMGIDRDYPLWRYCLWLRHNEMSLGGSAAQLAKLGARLAAGQAFCS
ncbi:MAG: acyl-CoA dehydrogenase family protein [Pseudomonadales bacterium]